MQKHRSNNAGTSGKVERERKDYADLKKIAEEAWCIIGTTFESLVSVNNEDAVSSSGTTVPTFTERLLRSILPLTIMDSI